MKTNFTNVRATGRMKVWIFKPKNILLVIYQC
jgi:hypothetical protein